MNKYRQAAISIAFLTMLLTGGLSANYANAKDDSVDDALRAKQEAILITFENDDYEEWKEIMGKNKKVKEAISQEDFEQFINARQAARSGNYDLAIKLSAKLELKLKDKINILIKQFYVDKLASNFCNAKNINKFM